MNNIIFDWQSRFHEHIVRTEETYKTIANYIVNNPSKWAEDSLFKNNIY